MRWYMIGSLRNQKIPDLANDLQEDTDHEVYADWFSAGPEADDRWRDYEINRGRDYQQAINGPHAWNVFNFDKEHIDKRQGAILVLPAGKSGHLELGYAVGQEKSTIVFFDGVPLDRWDVMYRFADYVCFSQGGVVSAMKDAAEGRKLADHNS